MPRAPSQDQILSYSRCHTIQFLPGGADGLKRRHQKQKWKPTVSWSYSVFMTKMGIHQSSVSYSVSNHWSTIHPSIWTVVRTIWNATLYRKIPRLAFLILKLPRYTSIGMWIYTAKGQSAILLDFSRQVQEFLLFPSKQFTWFKTLIPRLLTSAW